jgi:hypothetical protein
MNGHVLAALLGAVVAGCLTAMTSLIDRVARRRDNAVVERQARENAAVRRIAEAMAKLMLLPEDPRLERPQDRQYYEKWAAWEQQREELILAIDTESIDICLEGLRDRIDELCTILRFYQGNVTPADEFEFRRDVVKTVRDSLGAYRRGEPLPPLAISLFYQWCAVLNRQLDRQPARAGEVD